MFENRGKHKKENVLLDKTPHNNSIYFRPASFCLFVLASQSVGSHLWLFFLVDKTRIISSDLLITLGHQHVLWH